MLHIPSLYIMQSEGRGRGVFTSEAIEVDGVIELCPLVIIPKEQVKLIHQTVLHDYYFLVPNDSGDACFPLGYGLIYNHSSEPNAEVFINLDTNYLEVHCIKKIEAGEEIFINYQDTDDDDEKSKLWFEVK